MITPVILSGGSGTRLWPLSTPDRPKQFLPLVGEETLFRQTLRRVEDRAVYGAPIIVGSATHEDLCLEELAGVADARLILEPIARNTAVAIVMAAAAVADQDPSRVLLVMPSDHQIANETAFHLAVVEGKAIAEAGLLVTFGIEPTGPETGYGYIEAGEPLNTVNSSAFSVARFKEKPDAQTASAMLRAGNHFWNGGIFMFRADSFLEACRQLEPEVYECGTKAVGSEGSDVMVLRPELGSLQQCPNISVDYAVMERSDAIAMVPLNAGWSDVGSWDSLADMNENRQRQACQMLDSENCFVRTDGVRVALLGVKDLIIVGDGDQMVIMKRGRSQDIKRLAAIAAND